MMFQLAVEVGILYMITKNFMVLSGGLNHTVAVQANNYCLMKSDLKGNDCNLSENSAYILRPSFVFGQNRP